MLSPVFQNPWVRFGVVLGVCVLVAGLAYLFSPVLIPLFFAFLVAYIFDPLVDHFERRKIPRMAAVLMVVVALLVLALVAPLLLIGNLISGAHDLINAAREHSLLDDFLNRLPLEETALHLGWEPAAGEPFNARAVFAEKIGAWIQINAVEFLRQHAAVLANAGQWAGKSAADLIASLGATLMGSIFLVGNLALFAFVAIYLLRDYDAIIAQAGSLIPPRFQKDVARVMGRIDVQLRAFMRGQFMVGACLGILYAIGLSISGTPFALSLAFFGGMASMVPYLGLALTIIPATVLTLLECGLDWHVVGVLLTFGLAQFLEGNFLTPKIVGSQVGLGPVWVILAIMVFSQALGFLGLLLAVPIAAVLKVLVDEALVYYKTSRFFDPGEGPEAPSP